MSDLGRDIVRIARSEELQRQINDLLSQVADLKDKANKLGDRSTAYQTSSGGVGQSSGDKSASQVESDVGSALKDFSDGALDVFSDAAGNIDGTGADGTSSEIDPYSQDLNDLATNAPNEGSLIKQLTGFEEVGGSKEATIQLDGQFTPPVYPGSGFDSYNADTDPREDKFLQGVWYETAGGYESSNPYSSAQAYATAVLDPNDPPNAPHRVVSIDAYDEATASSVTVNMTRVAGTFTLNTNVYQSGCVVGTDSWCPSLRPVGAWEADSIHQLAFDGAQFVSNSAEAAADLLNSWSDSPSKVSGETSDGTGVSIEPTDTGGSTVTFTGGNQIVLDHSGIVTSTNY